MKKYISIIIPLAVLVLISACGQTDADTTRAGTDRIADSDAGETIETDVFGDESLSDIPIVTDEDIPFYTADDVPAYPDEDENAVVKTEGAPEGWPGDIPLFYGLEIVEGIEGATDESSGLQIKTVGNVPFDEAAYFYQNIPGWNPDRSTEFNPETDTSFIFTFTRGENEELMIIGMVNESGLTEIGFIYVK